MLRFAWALVAAAFAAFPVLADGPVPEKRFVVTRDVDFYGSDRQALFDTTLQACQRACLNDALCRAFTYNTRSRACFPKSAVSDVTPYEGAVSAQVVLTKPSVSARAELRAADLGFLRPNELLAAQSDASALGMRHAGGEWSPEELWNAARREAAAGKFGNAAHWAGAAVAQTDAADQWIEYARLTRLAAEGMKRGRDRRRLEERAQLAAINAYLRTGPAPLRANALIELATVLEMRNRGRDMLHALRLAETIQPSPDVVSMLDSAIAKYGFRIVEHAVEADLAAPRVCAEFSEPLVKAGVDYAPYVRVPDQKLAVTAEGNRICVEGVAHGGRYTLTFREGLPAASGEKMVKDVSLTVYVRDRSPRVLFPGRAYVLPRTADAGLPIETVNLSAVDLTLRRMDDRNILRAVQNGLLGQRIRQYDRKILDRDYAEVVWTGQGEVENRLNADVTTRLPVGDIVGDLPPGVYVMTASVPGVEPWDDPGAAQWFVLSDIGLASMSGADGLHVFARRLTDAGPMDGVKLSLLAQSNRVLGEVTTDAQGHAVFPPGLTRGTGAAAPALVLARSGDEDFAYLSLTDPAFDLSDRGVEGRPPAGPIDTFLFTERGAYRAGDTIHATALLRDDKVRAIADVPLTAVLRRPDGVEHSRHLSASGLAGGHSFDLPLAPSVPRGTWRLEVFADTDAAPLATQTLLVEDFLPERIDVALSMPEGPLTPLDAPTVDVTATYLFGAPGAGLVVDGDVRLRSRTTLDALPGYRFGRWDDESSFESFGLAGALVTDAAGKTRLSVPLGSDTVAAPREAVVTVRVSEGSGRPVERRITRDVVAATPMIGIRPLAEDVIPEGSEARFLVQAFGPDLKPAGMQVQWTLNRVTQRYQWYELYGNWNWEPITTRQTVARGTATLGADPVEVGAGVDWGRYELVVEQTGAPHAAASTDFYAGWYVPADVSTTPDTLELSLDKPSFRPGETAMLRIVPRYAGKALVSVVSNRLIHMQAVDVSEGETLIPLTVTEDWGTGAYVTAQVVRPMNVTAGQNPARSLGLAHAAVDPEERKLSVTIEAPRQSAPRGPLDAVVRVDGLGDDAGFVTLAAVDVGILNLTAFTPPDPSEHYFGQRRLGMELRDLYGRLIDGSQGTMGRLRQGGDASAQMRLESPPPTEDLVAYVSGPVPVEDGVARISFDIPEFNGTVRLMAVAWSDRAVGQDDADVLVRDAVVVTASLPRFMAPGDTSRLLLEFVHAEGAAGDMPLSLSADGLALGAFPDSVTLAEQGSFRLSVPVTAREVGDHAITVALTTPDGRVLEKPLKLGVRANDPQVSVTRRFSLAPGETFTMNDEVFADFRPETAEALLSAGPLARFDVPGMIAALNRYPYGCTEQVTSQTMPLLYLSSVAEAMGIGGQDRINRFVDRAVTRILTRQASNGSFGLWRAVSGDFWLDAYVSDFLTRAKAQGYDVPDLALANAMDNLRNRIAYAPDFDDGGEDIAYALMVLAREGKASMGDLRYYADEKADAFATALAQAQLGAALASYGDQTRADFMFAKAAQRISGQLSDETRSTWRADYGTNLRDAAGLLHLAVEAGSAAVNRDVLTARIAGAGRTMSTQERSWALLAAHSMVRDPTVSGLAVDGVAVAGPFVRRLDGAALAPMQVTNTATAPTDVTLTTLGVPSVPVAAGGYGYAITRDYFTMDGQPVSGPVKAGTRLVTVLTVRPSETTGARLMVDDPLPAGLEIDNPNLMRSGDVRALDWLKPAAAEHAEFRSDRFLAAVDWRGTDPFRLAYIVRAVSPGDYHHPAALVEDMYRPQYRANTDTGRLVVTE